MQTCTQWPAKNQYNQLLGRRRTCDSLKKCWRKISKLGNALKFNRVSTVRNGSHPNPIWRRAWMGFTSMTSHPTLWPRHHVSPLPLVPKQRPWYRPSIIHPRINCNPSMIISRSWRRFAFYILHWYQFLRLIISPFENPQISNPKIKKELLKHLMYKY